MLPDRCPKCDAPHWHGRQEIDHGQTDATAGTWHRRTWCKWCRYAQEEIAPGGLIPLLSRDQPIDPFGANPFFGPA